MANGERVDNVYVIDTKMYGFTQWGACYLVAGKEVALIDTGPPLSAEFVRTAIKGHGFALSDISYVFITHVHVDHRGSAGILLKEMPKAKVLIHPSVVGDLIDPSIINENLKRATGEKMSSRIGIDKIVPIPSSKVQSVNNGDVIDLGNDEKLRVIFAPGHASSEIAIYDEKNMGLFVGDAPGCYFAKEDLVLIPTPRGSDLKQSMETLKMLMSIPVTKLFFGHYGICSTPKETMQRALDAMQLRFDIASKVMRQGGKPEEIVNKVIIASVSPELEKLKVRGEGLYEYLTGELIPMWARGFAAYYQMQQQK